MRHRRSPPIRVEHYGRLELSRRPIFPIGHSPRPVTAGTCSGATTTRLMHSSRAVASQRQRPISSPVPNPEIDRGRNRRATCRSQPQSHCCPNPRHSRHRTRPPNEVAGESRRCATTRFEPALQSWRAPIKTIPRARLSVVMKSESGCLVSMPGKGTVGRIAVREARPPRGEGRLDGRGSTRGFRWSSACI